MQLGVQLDGFGLVGEEPLGAQETRKGVVLHGVHGHLQRPIEDLGGGQRGERCCGQNLGEEGEVCMCVSVSQRVSD